MSPKNIHLGLELPDSFCFQLLNNEKRSIADCKMTPKGEVIRLRQFNLTDHEAGLFVAGCRNIVLASEAVEIAREKAATLVQELANRIVAE